MRALSWVDRWVLEFDAMLRAVSGTTRTSARPCPVPALLEQQLTPEERAHAGGIMRINHCGEICAQALYHGHAMLSTDMVLQKRLLHAALEEGDHLVWCERRLADLGAHKSYLNPVWYFASWLLGLGVGMLGDDYILAFIAATEQQVAQHLLTQVALLPAHDEASRVILAKMTIDERQHYNDAIAGTNKRLSSMTLVLMNCAAKIMVKTAYFI